MALLDFDAYRDAMEQDEVKLGGKVYPLKVLTFREAASYRKDWNGTDFNDPEQTTGFLERFAAMSGIPVDVLESLTTTEIGELLRFFGEAQSRTSETHQRARVAALALTEST